MSKAITLKPSMRAAPRALRIWMADCEMSVKEMSRKLQCSEMQVSRLRKGLAKPGRALGFELERITEGAVTQPMWDEP